MILQTTICVVLLINLFSANSKFCKEFKDIEHKFYPLRHCQRSNKTVIDFSKVESLNECSEFAREKRALAFNFSPGERIKINLYQKGNESAGDSDDFYNCEALDCPEYQNFSSMVNDTRFDYYSLYTRPPREFKFNLR